jgi:large subunit ribosomal protein L30
MASNGLDQNEGAEQEQGSVGSIRIQWYRSTIGAPARQKLLVRSLGFTKLNQILERPDTASMRGAVRKAPHLLRIVA